MMIMIAAEIFIPEDVAMSCVFASHKGRGRRERILKQ
jgi:hypothetical protein